MRNRPITLTMSYAPFSGNFTMTKFIKGERDPQRVVTAEWNLRNIGDMDIDRALDMAKMFPNRDHVFNPTRRVA